MKKFRTNSMLDDLTGRAFARLTVVSYVGYRKWNCRCECGALIVALGYNLKSGHTKSCGCLASELITKHGLSGSRLQRVWANMKRRCCDQNDDSYKDYGGRGISVCDEWLSDFKTFSEWAFKNGYADNLDIDRIDNGLGYCPSNCRFVTHKTNMNNTRRNVVLEFNGKSKTLAEWAERLNVTHDMLRKRLRLGWSVERVLTVPVKSQYIRKRA